MRAALVDFRSSLDRIRDVANDITANVTAALADAGTRRRHETIQYASTVILSGYFESFLRDLARAFVRDLSGLGLPFGALPDPIRNSHFEFGGQILASVAKSERKGLSPRFPTSTTDVSTRLHSVVQAVPYDLLWEAFADTGANPGPDVVQSYLQRMGVEKVWPTLGLKAATHAVHRTETWLVANLKSFIAVRNECAHAGESSAPVLPSDLHNYCELFEALAEAMVVVLEDKRRQLTPATVQPIPPPAPPPLP